MVMFVNVGTVVFVLCSLAADTVAQSVLSKDCCHRSAATKGTLATVSLATVYLWCLQSFCFCFCHFGHDSAEPRWPTFYSDSVNMQTSNRDFNIATRFVSLFLLLNLFDK